MLKNRTQKYILLAASFAAVVIIATIALVLYYSPKTNSSADTHTKNEQFTYPIDTFNALNDVKTTKKSREKPNLEKKESANDFISSIMNSWKDSVTTATSSQITITTTSSKTKKYSPPTDTESILNNLNKQFQSGDTNEENDDIDEIIAIYNQSTDGSYSQVVIPQFIKEDKDLHNYGNELASLITSYQAVMGNQENTLDSFIKKQSNPNMQAILNLAKSYKRLSQKIENIKKPDIIKEENKQLSDAILQLSKQLEILSKQKTEESLYAQTLNYNKTSEDLVQSMLNILDSFTTNGVHFKNGESASIFNMPKLGAF